MKLYRIENPEGVFEDKKESVESTNKIAWAGTQADARKIRIEFEEPFKILKSGSRPHIEVEEVDVPTDKQGLLAWLNENAA